jgi:hypothetical protein
LREASKSCAQVAIPCRQQGCQLVDQAFIPPPHGAYTASHIVTVGFRAHRQSGEIIALRQRNDDRLHQLIDQIDDGRQTQGILRNGQFTGCRDRLNPMFLGQK